MKNLTSSFLLVSHLVMMRARRKKKTIVVPDVSSLPRYQQRFADDPTHVCFGCCAHNKSGLQIEFYDSGKKDELFCLWKPQMQFASFPNIAHGGIVATILDEVGGVALQAKLDTVAFTAAASIDFVAPLYLDRKVIGIARILKKISRYVLVDAALIDEKSKLVATFTGVYYIPKKAQLQKVLRVEKLSSEVESYTQD